MAARESNAGLFSSGAVVARRTAAAVANGGTFADGAEFSERSLAGPLVREGHDFVGWYTDASGTQPAVTWKAMGSGATYYARFAEQENLEDPVEYPGYQGLDQKVRLLDLAKLPKTAANRPNITYYGTSGGRYDNRIADPYDGNGDVVFAFGISKGSASAGTGAYQVSYTLPFISVIDAGGSVVASYDGGAGALRLFGIVFDGDGQKTSGNNITAFKVGVRAGQLDAGTYTLRFGAGLGASNGASTLGRDVDFRFTVTRDAQYELRLADGGATLAGIDVLVGSPVDVEIPEDVTAIADGAFAGVSVRSVVVPAGVKTVGAGAFADMEALEKVYFLSDAPTVPAFGTGVFSGSADCVLYAYAVAQAVRDAAAGYGNVTFAYLDDGIYANGRPVPGGGAVSLGPSMPLAAFSVCSGGRDITSSCSGYITNVNVATHESTRPGTWQNVTAKANGSCELVICAESGETLDVVALSVSGFIADASTERVAVTRPQGESCTIMMTSVDAAGTKPAATETTYNELAAMSYDNGLGVPVDATQAQFTLALAGSGSAWDITRWDFDDWKANHLDPNLWLEDASGSVVARIDDGLFWVTLTDSNYLTLGVESGVMSPGATYTLVAGANLSGHNTSSLLLKDVRWTFTAKATGLSALSVEPSSLPARTYTGAAIKPRLKVLAPVAAISMWSTAENAVVTTPASTRELSAGADYKLSWANNVNAGVGTVTAAGLGSYAGSAAKTFRINGVALGGAKLSNVKALAYNGKARTQAPVVKLGSKTLAKGTDYQVSYQNAKGKAIAASSVKAVGTYYVVVTGTGGYTGSAKAAFKISKAANPLTVKAKTASVKLTAAEKKAGKTKKARALARSKVLSVLKAQGSVTCAKKSGNAKIAVAKSGKVTVKAGCKRGTWKVRVAVKAAGNAGYKASAAKTVTFKVKVA